MRSVIILILNSNGSSSRVTEWKHTRVVSFPRLRWSAATRKNLRSGYVYKTMEYSAMILPRPQLLDDTKLNGDVRKVDSVIHDLETGENRTAEYNTYSQSLVS